MSSENLHSAKSSFPIFWVFMFFIVGLTAWGYFFQLEKSVTISGQVKPMGFPIIVQSRFEAKVKSVSVSEGKFVRKDDALILLEKNIDESELYELSSIFSSAIKIKRLENNFLKRRALILIHNSMKVMNYCLMR